MMTTAHATPAHQFRETLNSGRFLLTAELESPRSASAANVRRQAHAFVGLVDALDCTDNSGAIARMHPVAAALIASAWGASETGLSTLIQLTCRDRNRIALQSEILGAAAAGVAGVVCITGDPPDTGNHPDAMGVYDLTSVELIAAVTGMRAGRFMSGDSLDPPIDLVVGCVENPAGAENSIARLAAKADAGAEFVQTQIIFDVDVFARWMALLRSAGLHERIRVLAGIAPLRRLSIVRRLSSRAPGVLLPQAVLQRLERAADAETEGVAIAAETLRAVRQIAGVAGAHLLTFGWAEGVRRVLEAE
ncbi:MAG TPA: methylenetetrahydrofolate reductase [Dehalococcoidia bacterium]|nr:methylenetetrahydrofolate reductase [Dehalococcoidia bacterium]